MTLRERIIRQFMADVDLVNNGNIDVYYFTMFVGIISKKSELRKLAIHHLRSLNIIK